MGPEMMRVSGTATVQGIEYATAPVHSGAGSFCLDQRVAAGPVSVKGIVESHVAVQAPLGDAAAGAGHTVAAGSGLNGRRESLWLSPLHIPGQSWGCWMLLW